MNEHIKEYLINYFNDNNSFQSVLIDGEWGIGKSTFINDFFTNNETRYRKAKISLFGINSISELKGRIFAENHPIADWAGKGIKATLDTIPVSQLTGIDIIPKGDTVNKAMRSSVELAHSKVITIYVFDDLERTNLNFKSLFGFINELTENNRQKVVVIADMSKISKKQNKVFVDKREKVFQQTFKLQPDLTTVLSKIINDVELQSSDSNSIVKKVFVESNYFNFRLLRQALFDFRQLTLSIDDAYLSNTSFYQNLIYQFLILNIEYKKNSDVSLITSHFFDLGTSYFLDEKNKKQTVIKNIVDKYSYFNNGFISVFSSGIWKEIISESRFNNKAINNYLETSLYFQKTPEWRKLLDIFTIDKDYYERIYEQERSLFFKAEVANLCQLLHLSAFFLFISKKCFENAPSEQKTLDALGLNFNKNSHSYFAELDSIYDFQSSCMGVVYLGSESSFSHPDIYPRLEQAFISHKNTAIKNQFYDWVNDSNSNITELKAILDSCSKLNLKSFDLAQATLFFEKKIKGEPTGKIRDFLSILVRNKSYINENFWITLIDLMTNEPKTNLTPIEMYQYSTNLTSLKNNVMN